MPEKYANIGYMALKKQTSATVAVTPDTFTALQSSGMETSMNIQEDDSIVGHKAARHQYLRGMRHHTGDFSVLAEPNTAALMFDAFATKGTSTGSAPTTHPFTPTGDSNAYTVDFAKGREVHRFIGVQISQIDPSFDGNKMVLNCKASALKSFINRTVATVTGSGPYTITLDTDYDDAPTDGLVIGDLITLYDVSANAEIQAIVATIPTGTTLTVVANVSAIAAGDILRLRPATITLDHLTPFLLSKTEFRFGATASAALSASQTRLEPGSVWSLMHMFENDEGSKRSGGFDPASLIRTKADAEMKSKIFFDTPEDMGRFLGMAKRACVIRSFAQGTTYELRVTLNNLKLKTNNVSIEKGAVLYQDQTWGAQYDTTDGQIFDVKVLNAKATV